MVCLVEKELEAEVQANTNERASGLRLGALEHDTGLRLISHVLLALQAFIMLHLAALELPLPPLPRSRGPALESKSIHATIKKVWCGSGQASREHQVLNQLLVTCCPCMSDVSSAYSSPKSFQLFDDLIRHSVELQLLPSGPQSYLRSMQQLDSNRPLRYQPGRWGRARCTVCT